MICEYSRADKHRGEGRGRCRQKDAGFAQLFQSVRQGQLLQAVNDESRNRGVGRRSLGIVL